MSLLSTYGLSFDTVHMDRNGASCKVTIFLAKIIFSYKLYNRFYSKTKKRPENARILHMSLAKIGIGILSGEIQSPTLWFGGFLLLAKCLKNDQYFSSSLEMDWRRCNKTRLSFWRNRKMLSCQIEVSWWPVYGLCFFGIHEQSVCDSGIFIQNQLL